MPSLQSNRAKGRLLLGAAFLLIASLGAISLLSENDGAAPEVVEIVGPDSSKDDGGLGELHATEASRDDSLVSASSMGARREVLGEWGEAGEVLLRGRVEGRAGLEAVEGARVTVFFEDEKVQAVSASDGGFELVVPSGVPLDGEAFAHGYNLGRRFDLDPEEELIFRLAGATVIKGVILGPAAASFEGAQIRLWADDNRSLAHFTLAPDRLFSVTGDADGQNEDTPTLTFQPDERGAFEIFGLEPGEFDLSVEVPGWSYGVERDVILRAGETKYVEFELLRAGSAQARVVYEGTLLGVADCEVEVTPWIQGLSSEVERGASKTYRSDAEGWVELSWLNPGESRVKIRALNGLIKESTERLIVRTNKREILTWEIPGLHPLSGVVRDEDGGALKGGYVHLFSGDDSVDVYFGEPMLREDEGLPRSVAIGADGSYRFESLPADTVLTLSAVSSEEALAAGYSRVILASEPQPSNKIGGRGVSRLVAEAATHDFKIQTASRLEGLVQDSEGVAQADAKIHLYNLRRGLLGFSSSQLSEIISGQPGPELMSSGTHAATSDAEGRFVVNGLLPSDGWISAELDGYRKEWERVKVSEPLVEFTVELQSAESLSGRVVDLEGEPIPWASVNASKTGGSRRQRERWTKANEFGRFEFKMGNGRGDSGYLDEGEWTFVARASGREPLDRPSREVPGSEELLLTMGPAHVADAASLRGKVLLADGLEPDRLRLKQLRSAALSVDGGDFRITGLNPGSQKLVFEARGCAPKSLGEGERNELLLVEGEDRDLGLITMYPGAEVEVVVEAGEGRLDGAQVRFSPVGGHAVDSGSGTRRPGYERRGSYYMGALELGTWSMVVRANGHEKVVKEVVLGSASRRQITVKMKIKS